MPKNFKRQDKRRLSCWNHFVAPQSSIVLWWVLKAIRTLRISFSCNYPPYSCKRRLIFAVRIVSTMVFAISYTSQKEGYTWRQNFHHCLFLAYWRTNRPSTGSDLPDQQRVHASHEQHSLPELRYLDITKHSYFGNACARNCRVGGFIVLVENALVSHYS